MLDTIYAVLYNIHNPLFIASSHKLINNNRVVYIVTDLSLTFPFDRSITQKCPEETDSTDSY